MSRISIDLPDEVLAEVSRLAQEFNVPRAEIIARAVASLTARGELEKALEHLRGEHAETLSSQRFLSGELDISKQELREHMGELAELKRTLETLSRERQAGERELARVKAETERDAGERRKLAQGLEVARRRERKMGKLLADRTYLAIRSMEVERLRASVQKAIGHRVEMERRLEERQTAVGRLSARSAILARRLASLAKSRKELKEGYTRQRQETFRCERDIGRLRKELEKARAELKRVMAILTGKA